MPNTTGLTQKIFETMAKIKSKAVYDATMARIEELLPLVNDDTPATDKNAIELDLLTEMVEEYEEEHYPIAQPTLVDVMKLRMHEMGLNQTKLSSLLGVSPSRISDIFNGRCEPTLSLAREICRKMNVDANVALGV
jgi:HTH-type transcriptional regulator/antitoxin HigA